MAHNLFHLLAEGKSVLYTWLALFGANIQDSAAITNTETIQILQFVLVGLGAIISIYTVLMLWFSQSLALLVSLLIINRLISVYQPLSCIRSAAGMHEISRPFMAVPRPPEYLARSPGSL